MKFLHVTGTYASTGGIENYVLNLSRLLQSNHHQNAVIYTNPHPETLAQGGENIYYLPAQAHNGDTRKALLQVIQAEQPDVAFLHDVHDPDLIDILREMAPTVAYIHGFYPTCPAYGKFFHRDDRICQRPFGLGCAAMIYLRRCSEARNPLTVYKQLKKTDRYKQVYMQLNHLVVASEYMRSLMVQNGYDAQRISILQPHFQEVHPLTESQIDPPRILFAGRLEIEKGLPYLFRALTLIRTPWRLLVAGDGTQREKYQALAQELGIRNHVDFMGWLGSDDLDRAYQRSALLAFPSIFPEPFGKVGVEALAHGRPVVAFQVGGIGDWLEDGVNGYLVPPRDVHRLANRIERLLLDRVQASRMGIVGREKVARYFSPDQYLSRLLKIFAPYNHRAATMQAEVTCLPA